MDYEQIRFDVAEQVATVTLNRPERRNGFGIPNFCLIRTGHPDFQGPIVLTSQAFVPLVSLKVSAHCVMDASLRSFSMM